MGMGMGMGSGPRFTKSSSGASLSLIYHLHEARRCCCRSSFLSALELEATESVITAEREDHKIHLGVPSFPMLPPCFLFLFQETVGTWAVVNCQFRLF